MTVRKEALQAFFVALHGASISNSNKRIGRIMREVTAKVLDISLGDVDGMDVDNLMMDPEHGGSYYETYQNSRAYVEAMRDLQEEINSLG